MKFILFTFLFFFQALLFGQLNIDSVSHINYVQLHDTYLNDVWGFVDETGKEYALVGARKGTSVVDISDPENPVEVFWEPGLESVWRDLKTHGNYAYITTEAENGLLILDLTSLPDPSGITAHYYTGPAGSNWQSAHNLYIDQDGYAYIFGANRGNGGVIILDVHTNPLQPIEVGTFDNWYCHDGYVRDNTMYLAHISDGFLSIVDVTSKSNPVLLGSKQTSSSFTHNIWPSDNGQFAFTTDEVSGAFLDAYDVSDPSNIIQVDKIQSSPGAGVIPHNVHIYNDFIVTSYYSDGVTIHDASRPHNLVEVGNFDTYPAQTMGYDGCWGVYPFFPSGLAAAADITQGLFILRPNYQRASFIEGTVVDATTLNAIQGVKVQIQNHNQTEFTSTTGTYATGFHQATEVEVTFSKPAYYPQTHIVPLIQNQVVALNIELVPIPPFSHTVFVFEEGTSTPIASADIRLEGSLIEHNNQSNGLGEREFELYYEESYTLTVGKWGYFTHCQEISLNPQSTSTSIYLKKGYFDDFSFDFGWTTTSNEDQSGFQMTGFWERGIPQGTSTNSAPFIDADYDCGKYAYVTGNHPNQAAEYDEIKHGRVTLYSPIFDLTSYATPYIHYSRWFYNYHGPNLPYDDTLDVFLTNGTTTVKIDSIGSDTLQFYKWIQRSFLASDFLPLTASMQLIFTVADEDPDVNVTEAGVDFFFISEENEVSIEESQTLQNIVIYPNPAQHLLHILQPQASHWKLLTLEGKVVKELYVDGEQGEFQVEEIANGMYLLSSIHGVYKVQIMR
jgi:choice-of-anchor B domain-containing protein